MFIAGVMDQPSPPPRKQSIFKIISLNKHRPIFLCKVTDPHQALPQPTELVTKGPSSLVALRKAKQELQKVATKLNIIVNSPRGILEKRSESCDLSANGKSKGITEQRSEGVDRSRIQRSIKEYLRLAYQRAEKDRYRTGRNKLPSIAHPHNPEQMKQHDNSEEKKKENGEMRNLGSMKKGIRRRGLEMTNFRQQKQGGHSFRPELITGWEDFPSPEDF